MKIIKIDGKEYTMHSSALTQFTYKDMTGRSLLKDLKELIKLTDKEITIEDLEIIDNINDLVLPISYVMIREADERQVGDYKEFLKSIDNLYDDINWLRDVIELACSPISRQLQNN